MSTDETPVPDLAAMPDDVLAALGSTVLGNALREYQARVEGTAVPSRGFDSAL